VHSTLFPIYDGPRTVLRVCILREVCRSLSLERLHEFGDREIRGHGYKKMDMIFRNRTLYGLSIFGLAYLSDMLSEAFGYLSVQHFFRYLVIQTTWYLRSYTEWEVVR
jgi:hypothetical protein